MHTGVGPGAGGGSTMAKAELQLQVDLLAAALADIAGVLTADQAAQAAPGLRRRLDLLARVLDDEDDDSASLLC